MAKQYEYAGNLIGLGKRGGVLTHGKKEYSLGDVVPVGVLADDVRARYIATGVLIEKGAKAAKKPTKKTAKKTTKKTEADLDSLTELVVDGKAAVESAEEAYSENEELLVDAKSVLETTETEFNDAEADKKADAEIAVTEAQGGVEHFKGLGDTLALAVTNAKEALEAAENALKQAKSE